MAHDQTFDAIIDFRDWIAKGGEMRSGLQPGSFAILNTELLEFQSAACAVGDSLGELKVVWDGGLGDNAFAASLSQLVMLIAELKGFASRATEEAAEAKSQASIMVGVIERHIAANTRDRETLQRDMEMNKASIVAAQARLASARAELTGDRGFWNGVATGITFSIYNPVKENIDKANTAVARIRKERSQLQARSAQLNSIQRELRASGNGLGKVVDIDQHMARFQNTVVEADPIIQTAYRKLVRAEGAAGVRAAARYRERAREKIEELLRWEPAFNRLG